MSTPPASSGVPNKAPRFIWRPLLSWSHHRLMHFASAGFILTMLLTFLGHRNGEAGRQGSALLQQFIDHSVPSKTIYSFALGLFGACLIANRAVAKVVRKWLAKPMIELASHAFGVAFGVIGALLISASYVAELRPDLVALFIALGNTFVIFAILQLALWVARGRLDALLTYHDAIEIVAGIAGFLIAWAAVADINVELQRADRGHQTASCSKATAANASSSASAPAKEPTPVSSAPKFGASSPAG